MGKEPESGYLHPLLMVRAEFRKILLEMGFQEMPTNQFVESFGYCLLPHVIGRYGYEWNREEAMKNILRTHTTAVSTKELYKAAQDPSGFKPMKCFSIDRVFRNETMDATHLAEFHQVELFVADRNLNLGHLIGMIYDFFAKIGITDLRFKPAFNP